MQVTLIYDKRNVGMVRDASSRIEAELTKRVQRVFADAEVKVKPMQRNGLDTDASKSDKAILARIVEEMFDDAAEWLTPEE
ncbi:DinI-like family protein [Biostraticola tofi]|uniref:DinI-like family protein n=1 Tax=Biostraticola tofi TaxID=466109 RepID=A0A4R3YPY0_9GAMM|nr:DinI-like family protein [Biostraticola tofi]TCV92973.1 DinI-like family protein [Biostraticola tofi]